MNLPIRPVDGDTIRQHLEEFTELLRDGIDGGASMSFIAPLDLDFARGYWLKIANQVGTRERIVLAAFDGERVVGSVQLSFDMPPNQPHRVDLQKMLVHSSMRRRGLGAQILAAADEAVRESGRTLIVLDTARGSDAERLYERCGYQRVGVIPNFSLNYDGSGMIDTVYFYKEL